MEFEIGDVVKLKPRGPLMVVSKIDSKIITCTYWNKKHGAIQEFTGHENLFEKPQTDPLAKKKTSS
jgi:uncharacterized protein YodC (DUF2158 family)